VPLNHFTDGACTPSPRKKRNLPGITANDAGTVHQIYRMLDDFIRDALPRASDARTASPLFEW
jgi:hypothetical protein